jgi:hypothetical protein
VDVVAAVFYSQAVHNHNRFWVKAVKQAVPLR